MALLRAAFELASDLKLRAHAACIDHALREESGRELELVRSVCDQLRVPFHSKRLTLSRGPDLEARARLARYAALESIRVDQGLDDLATAHTAEDQAETVLMRLGRGTSLRGAGAIRERTGALLRPLVTFRRSEVRAFAIDRRLPFIDDPMNRDPAFTRVRVRERLLPALEDALGEGAVTALARFAHTAAEDEAVLAGIAEDAFDRLELADGALDAVGLTALSPSIARRVIRILLERAGIVPDLRVLQEAVEGIADGAQVTLPEGALLRSAGGTVRVVTPSNAPTLLHEISLAPGNWVPHEASGLEVGLDVGGGTWAAKVVSARLVLRTPRAGDRLVDGGKLQDLLVDRRIPREARGSLPVVVGEDGRVACVVGVWGAEDGPHTVTARRQAGRAAPFWSRC